MSRTVVLLLLAGLALAERDPGYDAVLDAYKARAWERFDRLARAFLAEKPDYEFAHSVRFMVADAFFQRDRYADAEAAARAYLDRHADRSLAARARLVLVRSLNEQWRYGDALAEAEMLDGDGGRYERGVALEGLRRFDEALVSYRAVGGARAEKASYRAAVLLFRARRFDDARAALEDFVARWPQSSDASRARGYLARIDPGYESIRDGVVLDYAGKYVDDARFLGVRARLPALRTAALRRIRAVVGVDPPDTFLVRFADSGRDRSGLWAEVRTERVRGEACSVLVLRTEHLVLDSHDVAKTLVHELYHCLQRERLGEQVHLETPKWVREGAALYVADQFAERAAILAAHLGSNPRIADPMARLVDGLGGRHGLEDYAEDACAFLAVDERHGPAKTAALLRRLLETPDVEAAVRGVLGEDLAAFELQAGEHARRRLASLVAEGRAAILDAKRKLGAGASEEALALLAPVGAYAPVASYHRALALERLDRRAEALATVQGEFLARHRHFSTLLGQALLLELRLLRDLGSDAFPDAARRARLDLEPFSAYPQVLALLGEEAR